MYTMSYDIFHLKVHDLGECIHTYIRTLDTPMYIPRYENG